MGNQGYYHTLLEPACYPNSPRRVFARDTHISRLYFTPRFVYKLKKPVDFGFLDFTSLDRRRFFCDEEVRLNCRYAPDTYLGVVTVRRHAGQIVIDSDRGEIIDYAVKMRRLPQAQMLDRKIRRHSRQLDADMDRLATVLVELFQNSARVEDLSPEQIVHSIAFNCEENLAQTKPFCDELLTPSAWQLTSAYTAASLAEQGLRPKLEKRAAAGLVREGHGDLHCEHICLSEPIRIYDCIEFNRRFRINDLLSELAFLLMDLDYRGRHDLAEKLFNLCRAQHPGLDSLEVLKFYQVYRAWVRGKVAALTSRGENLLSADKRSACRSARRHFALALSYLCPPFLAITCGLMGSGKSTLASNLAELCGAQLLRSDSLRKTLHGHDEHSQHADAFGQGLYADDYSRRTYAALLEQSDAALEAGKSVIVDASFAHAEDRQRFRQLALNSRKAFITIHLECDEQTILGRLATRKDNGKDISDGRPELFTAHKNSFERPKDNEIIEKIDSRLEVDYTIQLVLSRILSDHGWQA